MYLRTVAGDTPNSFATSEVVRASSACTGCPIDPREALVAPEPLVRLGRNDTHICAACQRRPCESTNHPGGYMIGLASVFHGSPDRAA